MKKIAGFLTAAVAVLSLNGCGGGSDSYDHIYYLQKFDSVNYVGVPDVYYDCGVNVGYTGPNGEFYMRDGDICTFYDLDETLSTEEYNVLYLGANASGTVGLSGVDYICDSDFSWSTTDPDGMFTYDPTYYVSGDICDFSFN
ncbi:hypothetical protein PGH07_08560 [Sulfurovum sp. zt1-1]|uniref:Lipoprotein n=1 Tax=Sulfurovum zhangzhouensis TaxID=3019067 RepID=A0ABT7QZG1_9BACT|nr:hypothetical protein [Sulfurovum zhangzhouensis]MDM5272231.1 hypothetical protein [Sulfurovum zhangzhouensis]